MSHGSNGSPGTVALLGVPIEVGASQKGALMGPAALRTAGLAVLLESLGFTVEDHGDLLPRDLEFIDGPVPPNTKHYREIQGWIRATSARAYAMARSGALPACDAAATGCDAADHARSSSATPSTQHRRATKCLLSRTCTIARRAFSPPSAGPLRVIGRGRQPSSSVTHLMRRTIDLRRPRRRSTS